MRLRILTEEDESLFSSVTTGGYCNVLQGANYAPSFSNRADHVRASQPRLRAVNVACQVVTWSGSAVNQEWTAGSTLTSAKLLYAFPAATITGEGVTAATCLEEQTYGLGTLHPTLNGVVTIPNAAFNSLEAATDDRSKAGTYIVPVNVKYDN